MTAIHHISKWFVEQYFVKSLRSPICMKIRYSAKHACNISKILLVLTKFNSWSSAHLTFSQIFLSLIPFGSRCAQKRMGLFHKNAFSNKSLFFPFFLLFKKNQHQVVKTLKTHFRLGGEGELAKLLHWNSPILHKPQATSKKLPAEWQLLKFKGSKIQSSYRL